MVKILNIKHFENNDILPEQLDDTKLLDNFSKVIENGEINGNRISEKDFSINFIQFLLKTRFLFDKYILKREYPVDSNDGVWSIKSLSGILNSLYILLAIDIFLYFSGIFNVSKTFLNVGKSQFPFLLFLQLKS